MIFAILVTLQWLSIISALSHGLQSKPFLTSRHDFDMIEQGRIRWSNMSIVFDSFDERSLFSRQSQECAISGDGEQLLVFERVPCRPDTYPHHSALRRQQRMLSCWGYMHISWLLWAWRKTVRVSPCLLQPRNTSLLPRRISLPARRRMRIGRLLPDWEKALRVHALLRSRNRAVLQRPPRSL